MARTPPADANWIDPDAAGGNDAGARAMSEPYRPPEAGAVDRFHNQIAPSTQAVLEALSELKATLAAIDARVAALETGEASALGLTRRLGMDVVEMGDALSRRVRALENQPAPVPVAIPSPAEPPPDSALFMPRPPPARRNSVLIAVSLGMLVALIVILAGAWALRFYNVRQAAPASRAAANVLDSGTVTIAPAAASNVAPAALAPPPVARRLAHARTPVANDDAGAEPIGHVLYNTATPPPKP